MNVAVLSRGAAGRLVAPAIAAALADACGTPCALVATLGGGAPTSLPLLPGAVRAAAALRRLGHPAQARGRLVWLADLRPDAATAADDDPAALAAALSTRVRRAAALVGAPAAVALPLTRSSVLDRVLAWHDGIVVVQEPIVADAIGWLTRESVAALGRPVATVPPPGRLSARFADSGLRTPAFATAAVAALGLGLGEGGR